MLGSLRLILVILLCASLDVPFPSVAAAGNARRRVIVLTDISSLTAGVAEPDDGQSLIRLLLYAELFDIEGLIATSNMGHGQVVRPELIHQAVDAYAKVQPNLLLHSPGFPAADRLRETIKAGQPVAGPKIPVFDSIGAEKDTDGAAWIIRAADKPDDRPVWVLIWGGSADLAQALWKVRTTRTPEQTQKFVSRFRVVTIGHQDSTMDWIKAEFPDLFIITHQRAYRGLYRGGDVSLASSEWVESHVNRDHGPLGDLYPNYNGGDPWGRVTGVKEGDTPAFLLLLPNGLDEPDEFEWGSWGGRFGGAANRLVDLADSDIDVSRDIDRRTSSVYRWRPAFQADFQARLDWCVKPVDEANHPPQVRLSGDRRRTAQPGDVIDLDASGSTDPDRHELSWNWRVYPPLGDLQVPLDGAQTPRLRATIPTSLSGRRFAILLSVTDAGTPRLTRYARVIVSVASR